MSNISREFFSTDIGMCGSFMRIVEVLCVPLYLYCLMLDHEALALILVRNFVEPADFDKLPKDTSCRKPKLLPTNFLCDKCSRMDSNEFAGRTFEFLFVEIMVFTFYLFTMTVYMLKSRCSRAGEDIGSHFENEYLALMANTICSKVPKEEHANLEQFYSGKERMIHIAGFIEIKCMFDESSLEQIRKPIPITKEEAPMWIKKNIVGRITKKELDDERVRETNLQDMM